jgi:hypothetical protein
MRFPELGIYLLEEVGVMQGARPASPGGGVYEPLRTRSSILTI